MKLQNVINILIILIILSPISFGIYRTYITQSDKRNQQFMSGKMPENVEGVLKGSVNNFKTNWIGKKFNSFDNTGINRFQDGENISEKYPFKTYPGKDLMKGKVDVLRIDYNVSENPFWLRFIVDEIVEVEDGKYLGKVYINLIPNFPFAMGYFTLER